MKTNNIKKTLTQRRIQHLGVFIDLTVKNIINERIESLLKARHITPSILSTKISETLRDCIYNEQEQQLQDMMDQIEQITAEKNKYQLELLDLQKKSSVKNAVLEDQNMMLRQKYANVNDKMQVYQTKLSQLPNDPEITFQNQKKELEKYENLVSKTQEMCKSFKEELEAIKMQTNKNLSRQIKYVQVILPTVIRELTKSLTQKGINEAQKETTDMEVKINEITRENEQLKAICNTLFQTLHQIHPQCKAFRSLTLNDVAGNAEALYEIECGIREIPSVIEKETKEEIENKLYTLYPQYKPKFISESKEIDINKIVLDIIER